MMHEAIYNLYPQVVLIDDSLGAFDKDGNKVEIDEIAVNQESKNILDKVKYRIDRKSAYPSVEDQLDILYHFGYEEWKSIIKKVKDNYPKNNT